MPTPLVLLAASTAAAQGGTLMLLRDYVARRLTGDAGGYFTDPSHPPPVGALDAAIDFSALAGRGEYEAAVAAAYGRLRARGAWLTPAELFTPHYGAALAAFAAHAFDRHAPGRGAPVEILELGGGTGTLARDVLTALSSSRPDLASRLTYTGLDASPQLAAAAAAKVGAAGHASAFRGAVGDARDARAWPRPPPGCAHTVVLACELLDNLPHDRVREDGDGNRFEAVVECRPDGDAESERQLADPLLIRALDAAPWGEPETTPVERLVSWALGERAGGPRAARLAYVPTGALALFDAAFAARPAHTLLASDFDALPGVVLPGAGAPLVAGCASGRPVDLPSITSRPPPGGADILFPTNFESLVALYEAAASSAGAPTAQAARCKAATLLRLHAPPGATATASGWAPMLDDFGNTSVLVGRSGGSGSG